MEEGNTDLIMAVAEDIRFNFDLFADDAFDGKATRVDFGLDILDDDPCSASRNRHGRALLLHEGSPPGQNVNHRRGTRDKGQVRLVFSLPLSLVPCPSSS